MSQTVSAAELQHYDFGDSKAPADFDPNASGYFDAPPGEHEMELHDFEVEENHQFNLDGDTHWLNQLRPKWRVVDGEHKGGAVQDFLPMPTPGRPMPGKLANRWGNFIKALGFELPPGRLVPEGFQLHDILNRRARVRVVQQMNRDKTPKFKNNGEPQYGVKYFGYGPLDGSECRCTPSTAPTGADAAAASQASGGFNPDEIDL